MWIRDLHSCRYFGYELLYGFSIDIWIVTNAPKTHLHKVGNAYFPVPVESHLQLEYWYEEDYMDYKPHTIKSFGTGFEANAQCDGPQSFKNTAKEIAGKELWNWN